MTQSTEQAVRNRDLARNTLLVAVAFGLAAAAGLVRNMIIARQFGLGAELDAYFAAFRLPDLLFTIVAGGALATAFIPVFADFLTEGDRKGGWRLASAITNLVAVASSIFALLVAIFAPWLVQNFIAPGFTPDQQAETVQLMRILLFSTIIFGISSVQTSVLHGFKQFLLPALAPVMYPLGVIAGALWLAPTMGITGLAIGAVLGSLLHLLVKVPGLIHYGFRWWPVLDLDTSAVRQVLVLMIPRILDLAVFQLTLVATTNLASRLDAGSVSALEWGWDAMQLPETIIGTAFGLVAFPTLAELAARHDLVGLRTTLSETLRAVITLTVPAAAGLILLGRPLLAMLYQGGSFDAAATEAVYVALRFFALGLVGHASLELVARAFFAQKDTVTPLLIAVTFGVVYVLLSLLLGQLMGHGGLALANSLAITGEVLLLLFVLRKRWGHIDARAILATLARVALATLVMSVAIWGSQQLLAGQDVGQFAALAVGGVVGAVVYIVTGLLLREPTLKLIPAALLGRGT